MLHVTVTVEVVVPVMDPADNLSELGTSVAVQGSAAQDTTVNVPAVEHVATPPGPYPVWHAIVTVRVVVPVMELAPV